MTPAARLDRTGWRPGSAAWPLWALAVLGIGAIGWMDRLLRQAGRPDLVQLNTAEAVPLLLASVSALTVGAVLASRRARHAVGWLLLTLGLSLTASGVTYGYAAYGLLARPESLPGATYLALIADATWILWPTCIGFILLLTPTGSLPSPRWRWWGRMAAVAPVVFLLTEAVLPSDLDPPFESVASPLAIRALADGTAGALLQAVGGLALFLTQLTILVAAGSLVVRFRRARDVERQQLRWVALAAALAGVAAAAVGVGTVTETPAVYLWATSAYVVVLPVATGAAIMRYRLYDLDRILSRTLAYGLLTVFLGVGYAGAVLLLGQLFGGIGDEPPSWAVAAATLAMAALVQPARRRLQQAVDRRFNRRRYHAAKTIQAFSVRLRQQVDLDALSAELLAVVDPTMQPIQVSLWLRPPTAASDKSARPNSSRSARP